MDFKNIKELSNSELALYKKELENRYEVLKTKINKLCDELDAIDKEYVKVEKETIIRQSKKF